MNPKPPSDRDLDRFDMAWAALDEDDPERALRVVRRCSPSDYERHLIESIGLLALDDLPASRAAMKKCEKLSPPADDVDYLLANGDLTLREWRIAEAQHWFERAVSIEHSAAVLDRLALCAELLHDPTRADRLLKEAEKVDPEHAPYPPRLPDSDFMKVVDLAVKALPEEFQSVIAECQVVVQPVPHLELARQGDVAEVAPDVLGLFSGPSLLERETLGSAELPPMIYLFQRNLERSCASVDDLKEEIRVTLYHELGHALGFDEEGVDKMGLA